MQARGRVLMVMAVVVRPTRRPRPSGKGTVIYNGSEANATVGQNGPDSISITGCRMILCQTIVFSRMPD